MKNSTVALSAAGGAVAFGLRLAQRRFDFSEADGLPVNGSWTGWALFALLLLLAAALFLLAQRRAPGPDSRPFQEVFTASGAVVPIAAGLLLVLYSGVAELASGWMTGAVLYASGLRSPQEQMIVGACAILAAAGFYPVLRAMSSGKYTARKYDMSPGWLLGMPVMLSVRLVFAYRAESSHPAVASYCVELLALAFSAVAFTYLAAFGFGDGRFPRLQFWSGTAAALCLTTLADGHGLSGSAFYGGCALILLGVCAAWRPAAHRRRGAEEE